MEEWRVAKNTILSARTLYSPTHQNIALVAAHAAAMAKLRPLLQEMGDLK